MNLRPAVRLTHKPSEADWIAFRDTPETRAVIEEARETIRRHDKFAAKLAASDENVETASLRALLSLLETEEEK